MTSRNKPKNVSAWLGGNRGTVQSGSSTEQQVDTGGGEKDAVNSTLALGLAGAAGLTAAGVALRRTGVGARAVRETYFGVHGSPTQGLSSINNQIGARSAVTNPAAKSAGYNVPNSPVAYSYPAQPKYVTGDLQTASAYARDGSVYVVKAPKQNVNVAQWNTNERYSLQPMKVVKEIKMPKLPNPAPMSATKEVKQSVEASIVAARKVADAKMIKQVQNVVRQQKIKTFLQGAIGKR